MEPVRTCEWMVPRKRGIPDSVEQVRHASPDYTYFFNRQMGKPLSLHQSHWTGPGHGQAPCTIIYQQKWVKLSLQCTYVIPQHPKIQHCTNCVSILIQNFTALGKHHISYSARHSNMPPNRYHYNSLWLIIISRSQWPRSLRRGSAAARLLGLRVRIRRRHECLCLVSVVCVS
jgi:hypothetical protein